METIRNGQMVLEMVTNYRHGDRSAIVCKRTENNYIVGKNYTLNDLGEVSWCWGAYDFPTADSAVRCALAWCFE